MWWYLVEILDCVIFLWKILHNVLFNCWPLTLILWRLGVRICLEGWFWSLLLSHGLPGSQSKVCQNTLIWWDLNKKICLPDATQLQKSLLSIFSLQAVFSPGLLGVVLHARVSQGFEGSSLPFWLSFLGFFSLNFYLLWRHYTPISYLLANNASAFCLSSILHVLHKLENVFRGKAT